MHFPTKKVGGHFFLREKDQTWEGGSEGGLVKGQTCSHFSLHPSLNNPIKSSIVLCISFSFSFAGLIISGGNLAQISVETFTTQLSTCNIPLFPAPGNIWSFSSSYSPPKGDASTPSLSLTTDSSWSCAEGTEITETFLQTLLASLGAVGKMNGLTTQHWGKQ